MKKLLTTVSLMALLSAPSFGSDTGTPSLDDLLSRSTQMVAEKEAQELAYTKLLDQYKGSTLNIEGLLKNPAIESLGDTPRQAVAPHLLNLSEEFATLTLSEKIATLTTTIKTLEGDEKTLIDLINNYRTLHDDPSAVEREDETVGSTPKPTEDEKEQVRLENIIEILSVEGFTPSDDDAARGTLRAMVKYDDGTSSGSAIALDVIRTIQQATAQLRLELWCLNEQKILSKLKKKNQQTLQWVKILQNTETTTYTLLGNPQISYSTKVTGSTYQQRDRNQYTSCSETQQHSHHHGHLF